MKTFIINALLSLLITWFALEAYIEIPRTAFSATLIFIIAFLVLWLCSFFYARRYFFMLPKIFGFMLFYLKVMIGSSLKTAYDALRLKNNLKPGVIAFPLTVKSDLEITLLANFITLTPGTISIDISADKKILFIYDAYANGDLEKKTREIRDNIERRVINIFK